MKKIAILGSTGSIGTQTLEIVRTNKDIEVTALAAGRNIDLLERQIREFRPKLAAVWSEELAAELKTRVKDLPVEVLSGMDGLLAVAAEKDSEILVTAIVGMIGIRPTIEAIRAGKDIALANPGYGTYDPAVSCQGTALPLHPGAEKYYREAGYLK